jgi:cysteinyl-tRNA synthetase
VALQAYNVRTRRKEPFAPLHPDRVTVYVCGLTVYDHVHIGHARTAVSFEVIRRWLEHRHPGRLRFVQNVTDVDDKIIQRAKEQGVSPREHAALWDRRCAEQVARLGVRPPDEAPHVTQSIPDIVRFIEGIVRNGFAYPTPEGSVYFDVPRYQAHAEAAFPSCGYGSLSNRDYREMAAGTRKQVESDKRHPADFALWKAADPDDHPDANWESPWGKGRPGWHIECSLMSTRALGDRIDIHGGGQDLIFPHHENEIAQSQAKTGKAPFVNCWLHTGFLNVEGEKMSKSLNNFITLKDALDGLEAKGQAPEVLRFYFLQTHYRSKIDFQQKGLEEAAKAVERLERTRHLLTDRAQTESLGCADMDIPIAKIAARLEADFGAAMDDDFHTPGALAALFDFQREANRLIDAQTPTSPLGSGAARQAVGAMERCGHALTLFDRPARSDHPFFSESNASAALQALVMDLLGEDPANKTEQDLRLRVEKARAAARNAKDWKRSDEIRDRLKQAGYLLEDTPNGQRWSRL